MSYLGVTSMVAYANKYKKKVICIENTLALNVPQLTIMDKNVLCVHIIHDPCPNISIMSKARTNIEAPWVKRARIFIPQS